MAEVPAWGRMSLGLSARRILSWQFFWWLDKPKKLVVKALFQG